MDICLRVRNVKLHKTGKRGRKKRKKEKKKREIRTVTCEALLLVKAALVLGVHFSLDKMASGIIKLIFLFKSTKFEGSLRKTEIQAVLSVYFIEVRSFNKSN
jgi:hypothetical protein